MNKDEQKQYLLKKREEVLDMVEPMLRAFGIYDFDYQIGTYDEEYLIINGQVICTTLNSISAIRDEVIGYLFVNIWNKNRNLGAFKTQTLNVVKRYWK